MVDVLTGFLQRKGVALLWLLLSGISAGLSSRYGVAIFDLAESRIGRRLMVWLALLFGTRVSPRIYVFGAGRW